MSDAFERYFFRSLSGMSGMSVAYCDSVVSLHRHCIGGVWRLW